MIKIDTEKGSGFVILVMIFDLVVVAILGAMIAKILEHVTIAM